MSEVSTAQIQRRTFMLGLNTIGLVSKLPKCVETSVLGRQLLRSSTSVGANYRAACRARSKAEFIAKMGIVEEEADETIYWLELLQQANFVTKNSCAPLLIAEANEILAMTVASIKTARGKSR